MREIMNKDIDELIATATHLSERLDKMANEEKRFTTEICLTLDRMSWDIFRASEDLNEIKNYCEG
jgi:hypothetical protein